MAVTGATGDVGFAVLAALERSAEVGTVRAVARSHFDPAAFGLRKVRFRRGDVRDRAAVRDLVNGSDVVVHLAFALHGRERESRAINLDGSRIVFEEAVAAEATRLCYASSVGAYGSCHEETWIDEKAPLGPVGGEIYAEQKAAAEALLARALAGSDVQGYALRLAIVVGPRARLMLREIPYVRIRRRLPRALLEMAPSWLRPVLPDTGVPLQVVHESDAAAAFLAAATGRGDPGAYNVAAADTITVGDLASELGWRSVRIPRRAVDLAARAARLLPPSESLAWLEVARAPLLVAVDKARDQLGWTPGFSGSEAIAAMVRSYRADGGRP